MPKPPKYVYRNPAEEEPLDFGNIAGATQVDPTHINGTVHFFTVGDPIDPLPVTNLPHEDVAGEGEAFYQRV